MSYGTCLLDAQQPDGDFYAYTPSDGNALVKITDAPVDDTNIDNSTKNGKTLLQIYEEMRQFKEWMVCSTVLACLESSELIRFGLVCIRFVLR